jgi:hypothetical protein
LSELCQSCEKLHASQWVEPLSGPAVGEAVALPVTDEAEGKAPRLHLLVETFSAQRP